MEAGEAAVESVSAEISKVLNQIFFQQSPPLSLFVSAFHSFFLASLNSNTQYTSVSILSLFLCHVNSVINHPVTVTELLLIVISPLPCTIVLVP